MELLVTLRRLDNFGKLMAVVDGFIIGGPFTVGYNFSPMQMRDIASNIKQNKKKLYIALDNFISEDELADLNVYLEFLKKLDVDGIYFHDFAVLEAAKIIGLKNKLIYDGKSVLCNSLETAYHVNNCINGAVISRELTLEEITNIIMSNKYRVDLQIFGHLRMSTSKRKFISNYLKQINKEYNINKLTFTLKEELRDYNLPIIEDKNGTHIYTDYIFEMYRELGPLKEYINRGIVDTLFIPEDYVVDLCRDYKKLKTENSEFLRYLFTYNHPDNYSSGYLYQKTNITKEDE